MQSDGAALREAPQYDLLGRYARRHLPLDDLYGLHTCSTIDRVTKDKTRLVSLERPRQVGCVRVLAFRPLLSQVAKAR